VVIAVAPLLAVLWVKLAARGRHVDIVWKFFFALIMAMLGNGLMYAAAWMAARGERVSIGMPFLGVSLLGCGEIVAWTATYGFVSRAAPAGYASMTMGAWYLMTLGLGGYLSGVTGAWVDTAGYAATFAGIAAAMAVGAGAALALRSVLIRLAARASVAL
jgi:POT family proton-dependent oligopeptide transporter